MQTIWPDSIKHAVSIQLGTVQLSNTGIDGCSGLFKDTSATQGETEYTLATNLQSKAFVHINGKMIELQKSKANNSEGLINEEYEGGGYKVLLNVKEGSRLGDELFQYKGELIIRQNSKEKKINIVGEVGC